MTYGSADKGSLRSYLFWPVGVGSAGYDFLLLGLESHWTAE